MKKILLIYPSETPNNPDADMSENEHIGIISGLLSIATFLSEKGYPVKLLDTRVYKKTEVLQIIKNEIADCLCVGFSVMTAHVKHSIILSDYIKKISPSTPVIWGGIHTTLYPYQTIQDSSVDYIVQGEGEYSFLELLKYLNDEKDNLSENKGLGYKLNGKIILNPSSDPLDVKQLPLPDYSFLDTERYVGPKFSYKPGEIKLRALYGYHISRGCPYQCNFCVNNLAFCRKWRSYDTGKILEHLGATIQKYKLNHIWFSDEYFFGNLARSKAIAEFLIEKKYNITWEATARGSDFNDKMLNDEFLSLLKKSGCWMLRMGGESGSNRVLKMLNKNVTTEQFSYAVKKCYNHGIIPTATFMVGLPDETFDEIKMTYRFIGELNRIAPNCHIPPPYIFIPFPGTTIFKRCVELGFEEPKSLREWMSFAESFDSGNVDCSRFRWMKNIDFIKDCNNYVGWFQRLKEGDASPVIRFLFIRKLQEKLANIRFEYNWFTFRIDSKIVRLMKYLKVKIEKIISKPVITDEVWENVWRNTDNTILEKSPFRIIDEIKYEYLKQYLPEKGRSIEIGCGSGRLSLYLAQKGYETTLLDNSPAALDVAKRNYEIMKIKGDFVLGDALRLPFNDNSFDVVISTGLLEHFEEPIYVMKEMVRILKPGGLFYSDICPKKFSLLTSLDFIGEFISGEREAFYEKKMDKKYIEQLLDKLYLQKVKVFSAGVLPPRGIPLFRSKLSFVADIEFKLLKTLKFVWKSLDDTVISDLMGVYYFVLARKPKK